MGEPNVEEVNKAKSEGARKRWNRESTNALGEDKKEKRFNFKCFDGLHLSPKQKEFVVVYMDPPFLGRKEFRYQAYKKVFNPSNDNSTSANCTALLGKAKIKEAMRAYQIFALKNHKQEVTSESIEIYRKRATYTLDKFFESNGKPKPLDDIDPDWMVCIDNIERKLSTKTETDIVNYKLCDRDKAMGQLQKMLDISGDGEKLDLSISSGNKSVIDDAEGKSSGPRITLNMSIGNQNRERDS